VATRSAERGPEATDPATLPPRKSMMNTSYPPSLASCAWSAAGANPHAEQTLRYPLCYSLYVVNIMLNRHPLSRLVHSESPMAPATLAEPDRGSLHVDLSGVSSARVQEEVRERLDTVGRNPRP
jgi:hypothetical protein